MVGMHPCHLLTLMVVVMLENVLVHRKVHTEVLRWPKSNCGFLCVCVSK